MELQKYYVDQVLTKVDNKKNVFDCKECNEKVADEEDKVKEHLEKEHKMTRDEYIAKLDAKKEDHDKSEKDEEKMDGLESIMKIIEGDSDEDSEDIDGDLEKMDDSG